MVTPSEHSSRVKPTPPVDDEVRRLLEKASEVLSSEKRVVLAGDIANSVSAPNIVLAGSAKTKRGVSDDHQLGHTDQEQFKYVLKRLISGVATSQGGARENMSVALATVCKLLLMRATGSHRPALDDVAHAIVDVYARDESPRPEYAGAERESALGALTCCLAVVTSLNLWLPPCAQNSSAGDFERNRDILLREGLSISAVHTVIMVLRNTANANDGKWGLGIPCVLTARLLLRLLPPVDIEKSLAEPLVSWCKSRKGKADGLALALLLLVDLRWKCPESVEELYPCDSSFESALLDSFESGFPIWPVDVEPKASKSTSSSKFHLLPLQWQLVVPFVHELSSRKYFGGSVRVFWSEFVVKRLIASTKSADKRTVALCLFPKVVFHLHSMNDFEAMLTDSLAGCVIAGRRTGDSGSDRGSKGVNKSRRPKSRHGKRVGNAHHLCDASISFFDDLLDSLKAKQAAGCKDIGNWACALVRWVARKRIPPKWFGNLQLAAALSLMSSHDVDSLLLDLTTMFAKPGTVGRECDTTRCYLTALLMKIASIHPSATNDICKALSLYSVFTVASPATSREVAKSKKSASANTQPRNLSVKYMLPRTGTSSNSCNTLALDFGGLLPLLVPSMSNSAAFHVFQQVSSLELSTSSRAAIPFMSFQDSSRPGDEVSTLEFVDRIWRDRNRFNLRLRGSNDSAWGRCQSVIEVFKQILMRDSDLAIMASLRYISFSLALFLYSPMTQSDETDQMPSTVSFFTAIAELCGNCANALFGEKCVKVLTKDAIETDEERDSKETPTALEQVTYLICQLCTQKRASFGKTGQRAFEKLRNVTDLSVSAVIFDMIYSEVGSDEADDDSDASVESSEEDSGSAASSEAHEEGDDPEDDESDDSARHVQNRPEVKGSERLEHVSGQSSVHRSAKDKDISRDAAVEQAGSESSGEESDDDLEIMVDDEDPKVLEDYDKVLSQHMKNLKADNAQKKIKHRDDGKKVYITRLMHLLKIQAGHLRSHLGGLVATEIAVHSLYDLVVGLVELAYSSETTRSICFSRILSVFASELDVPWSFFSGRSLSEEATTVLLDRFLAVLPNIDFRRRGTAPEVRMLGLVSSALANLAVSHESLMEKGREVYKRAWSFMVSNDNRLLNKSIFVSGVARIPKLAIAISELAHETIVDECSRSGAKCLAANALLSFAPVVRDDDASGTVVSQFWDLVYRTLSCTAKAGDSRQYWKHGSGLAEFLKLVVFGLDSECLKGRQDVGDLVRKIVAERKIPRRTMRDIRVSLRTINEVFPSNDSDTLGKRSCSEHDAPEYLETKLLKKSKKSDD